MTGFSVFRHEQVPVGATSLHVVSCGDPGAPAIVFVHGWPCSWSMWREMMTAAATAGFRAVAFDLPGIGESTGDPTDGTTLALAGVVDGLLEHLAAPDVTLVGHDIGGMVAYSYLRTFRRADRVAVLDVAVPGVSPWEEVLTDPEVWHLAFHASPGLAELLVTGHERDYFDWFFDVFSPDPDRLTEEMRDVHTAAYRAPSSLHAGFVWFRRFGQNAIDNRRAAGRGPTQTPLLYLRGAHEGGEVTAFVEGFHEAGVGRVASALVPGAGHFAPQDSPAAVWRLLVEFIARPVLAP